MSDDTKPDVQIFTDEAIAARLLQFWKMDKALGEFYNAFEESAFGETMTRELTAVYEAAFNSVKPTVRKLAAVIREARTEIAARDNQEVVS